MNGYSLDIVSLKTGLGINKLKSIVSRNTELQEMPYSLRNGGNRIFFESFINWLKDYEGITKVAEVAPNMTYATSATKLPTGAQMNAMVRIFGTQEAGRRIDLIMGFTKAEQPKQIGFSSNPKANAVGHAAAYNQEKREAIKAETDRLQNTLGIVPLDRVKVRDEHGRDIPLV